MCVFNTYSLIPHKFLPWVENWSARNNFPRLYNTHFTLKPLMAHNVGWTCKEKSFKHVQGFGVFDSGSIPSCYDSYLSMKSCIWLKSEERTWIIRDTKWRGGCLHVCLLTMLFTQLCLVISFEWCILALAPHNSKQRCQCYGFNKLICFLFIDRKQLPVHAFTV